MTGTIQLVTVSFLSMLIVISLILFYRFIFPKKKLNPLFIIILLSIPPIVSIFRPGLYESSDFFIHTFRTISFYHEIESGHFLPSWASELNAGYGYPLFIFNYPLPYYFISFFHLLGASFILSVKLFLSISFILSGIGMYLFARKVFKNNLAAVTAAVFYQFAPYHLIDTHFKVVIGELLVFAVLPFLFFFLREYLSTKKKNYLAILSLLFALLIMSHVVIALFIIVVFLSYAFVIKPKTEWKKTILFLVLSVLGGLILSIYSWLGPVLLSRYTVPLNSNFNFAYFPQLWELFYAPWRWGFLYQGPEGHLSFFLGFSQIFSAIAICLLLINKIIIKNNKEIIYWLSVLIIIIFLITPASQFFWGLVPFLKITGSHRLLLLAAFVSAILGGYLVLTIIKRKIIIYLLIFIAIFSTILNWGQRRVLPEINDQVMFKNIGQSTARGEGHFYARPLWLPESPTWFSAEPKSKLEVIKGDGVVKLIEDKGAEKIYVVNAITPITLRENTVYFPGWTVKDTNKEIIINYKSSGLINFPLSKGLYLISVTYQDVFIFKLLKIISIAGFLVTIIYLLYAVKVPRSKI